MSVLRAVSETYDALAYFSRNAPVLLSGTFLVNDVTKDDNASTVSRHLKFSTSVMSLG
jgi:hypothetical protein